MSTPHPSPGGHLHLEFFYCLRSIKSGIFYFIQVNGINKPTEISRSSRILEDDNLGSVKIVENIPFNSGNAPLRKLADMLILPKHGINCFSKHLLIIGRDICNLQKALSRRRNQLPRLALRLIRTIQIQTTGISRKRSKLD